MTDTYCIPVSTVVESANCDVLNETIEAENIGDFVDSVQLRLIVRMSVYSSAYNVGEAMHRH